MSKIEIERYVTTVDGKRYLLGHPDNPQLWACELRIKYIDSRDSSIHFPPTEPTKEIVFVDRAVLEAHGLLPIAIEKTQAPSKPVKTAEDLILELLEHVGVFPQ